MDLWLCSITTQPSLDVGGHWTLLCLGPTASSCTFSDRMTGKILSSQWGPVMFRRTEPVSSCTCTSQRHDKGQDKALWSSFQIRNGVYIRMYTYICTHTHIYIYIYTNVYIIESYRIHLIFTFRMISFSRPRRIVPHVVCPDGTESRELGFAHVLTKQLVNDWVIESTGHLRCQGWLWIKEMAVNRKEGSTKITHSYAAAESTKCQDPLLPRDSFITWAIHSGICRWGKDVS